MSATAIADFAQTVMSHFTWHAMSIITNTTWNTFLIDFTDKVF